MEAGDQIVIDKLTITATHAKHSENEVGFILESDNKTIFFAGDTKRDDRLFRLGEKHDIDLAVLPIGGNPNPIMVKEELDPNEAAELSHKINAKYTLPTDYELAIPARFWGSEELTSVDTIDDFSQAMKKIHPKGELVVLGAGESWSLPD